MVEYIYSKKYVVSLYLFVTGVAKSGTSLAARLIESYPGVSLIYESDFLRNNIFPRLNGRGYSNPLTAKYIKENGLKEFFNSHRTFETTFAHHDGAERQKRLSALVFEYYDFYKVKMRAKIVGEKSPKYTFHHDRIHSLLPDSKIISLVRHPISVYASALNFTPNEISLARKNSVRLHQFFSPWKARAGREANAMELVKKWVRFADLYRENRLGECHVIRYEDLVQSPQDTMDGVFAYCGLDPIKIEAGKAVEIDKKKYAHVENATKSLDENRISELGGKLPTDEVAKVLDLVENQLDIFGYSRNPGAVGHAFHDPHLKSTSQG